MPHDPLKTKGAASGLLPLIAVLGMIALVVWCMEPPLPQPTTATPDRFAAARALVHIRQIAHAPHPPGSLEHRRVRDYIAEQFRSLSLQTRVQTTVAWRSQNGFVQAARVENIIARLPGRGTGKAILLAAHYDSHPTGPGAGDDGAGVATLLETARALTAGAEPNRDVFFVITDAEEWGLIGAEGFVRDAPEAKTVGAVLNFEARGGGGPVFMFETSDGNASLIGAFAGSAPRPLASSLMYSLYKLLPNDTDLTVFKEAGLPGLNFAFAGRWTAYHTTLDTPDNLDLRSVQHHGDYALTVARRLASQPDVPKPRDDATYFDVLSRSLVHYPLGATAPLTGLALALLTAVILRWRKEAGFLRAWGVGLVAFPLTVLTGGVAAYLFAIAIAPLRARVPWSDPYDARLLESAVFAIAGGLVWLVWLLLPQRFAARPLLVGALTWWGVLSVLTAAFLPGAAYLFVWPLIFGAAASLLRSLAPSRIIGLLSLVLTVPTLHGIALLLGFGLPPALGILAAVSAAPLLPLLRGKVAKDNLPLTLAAPVLLLLAGFTAVGIAYVRNVPSSDRPRTNTLFYFLDADNNTARWISADAENDVWTNPFLRSAVPVEGAEFFPWSRRTFRAANAVPLALPAPEVRQTGRRLTIRSRRGAEELVVSGQGVRAAWLNGRKLPVQELFCLRFLAPPLEGITLEMDADAGTQLSVDDYAYGLPPGTPPRPAFLIAQPLAPATDRTIVRTRIRFETARRTR